MAQGKVRCIVVCLKALAMWDGVVLKCSLTDVELGVGFSKAHVIKGSGSGIDVATLLIESMMNGGRG